MAKKNPFVTTIGFNKDDPDHVYVADILNTMGRGKAQYIVKAVIAYQNPAGEGSGHVPAPAVDYEKIRAFVLNVLEEKACVGGSERMEEKMVQELVNLREKVHEKVEFPNLDEDAMNDIMMSLSMFQ